MFTSTVDYWAVTSPQWAALLQPRSESAGDDHADRIVRGCAVSAATPGRRGLFQVMPFHFAAGENQLDPGYQCHARGGFPEPMSGLGERQHRAGDGVLQRRPVGGQPAVCRVAGSNPALLSPGARRSTTTRVQNIDKQRFAAALAGCGRQQPVPAGQRPRSESAAERSNSDVRISSEFASRIWTLERQFAV